MWPGHVQRPEGPRGYYCVVEFAPRPDIVALGSEQEDKEALRLAQTRGIVYALNLVVSYRARQQLHPEHGIW